jgi:hypothetical protein
MKKDYFLVLGFGQFLCFYLGTKNAIEVWGLLKKVVSILMGILICG